MRNSKIGLTIVGVLIAVISISSCTYRSHGPGYDNGYRGGNGYGYGYRYAPPPRVVVVRPTPPPRVIYRNNGRARHYSDRRSNRNYNRQSNRQYGHNGRTHGPR